MVEQLRSAAAEEARLGAPVLAFYHTALPVVPCLLTGFLCREGAELVRAFPPPCYYHAHPGLRQTSCSLSAYACLHRHMARPLGGMAAEAWQVGV